MCRGKTNESGTNFVLPSETFLKSSWKTSHIFVFPVGTNDHLMNASFSEFDDVL